MGTALIGRLAAGRPYLQPPAELGMPASSQARRDGGHTHDELLRARPLRCGDVVPCLDGPYLFVAALAA